MRSYLTLLFALLLTACSGYEFRVNEQVWHTPQPLLADFHVNDAALKGCLEQAIADHEATSFGEVTRLDCSHAGIEDLSGLEQFSAIQLLKLSNNKINDFSAILYLQELTQLSLKNNQLSYAGPLLSLKQLEMLDLRGNDQLACEALQQARFNGELKLPKHCR